MHCIILIINLGILFLKICCAEYTKENMPGAKYYDGKKISLPVNENATFLLYDYWINQAISAFLASFATEKYHCLLSLNFTVN